MGTKRKIKSWPLAAFKVTGIVRNTNGSITLSWQSEAGAKYQVETTTALGSPWSILAADVPGLAGTTSFTDSNPPVPARFYRMMRR